MCGRRKRTNFYIPADTAFYVTLFSVQLIMADITTVLDAMVACGVDNEALFMDETQAQRIADDVFSNLFTSCMDATFRNWMSTSRPIPI